MSSNTVVTGNVNVANQINIMNMAGRKKRAAHLGTIHILRNHSWVEKSRILENSFFINCQITIFS